MGWFYPERADVGRKFSQEGDAASAASLLSYPPTFPLCHFLTFLIALVAAFAHLPARAEIPEPDNVLWGLVTLAGQPVTAAQTNVVIEARKTANGPVVASYRMGEAPAYGDLYSLRVPIEAFLPLTDTNASRIGGLIYLTVRDDSGVRVTRNTSIPSRGKVTRVDFVELDSDGDGLPDAWEQRFFGNPTIANPNADPDGDGRNNRDEFLAGTDPTRADGRHPADAAPADNAISLDEFTDYTDAWFFGDPWTSSPTNIPIAYATRAAFLWLAGESYVFTNAPPNTNAPLWWVNTIPIPGYVNGNNVVAATLPATHHSAQPLTIPLLVTPSDGIYVHAIEDAVPAGWTVLTISHGGNYDANNRKVKWGPFFDAGQRDLAYTAQPPAATNVSFTFTAQASFDGRNLPNPVSRLVQLTTEGAAMLLFTEARLDAQGPRFTLCGANSTRYVLEVSTNLTTWTALQTITTDAAGLYLFRPANPAQSARRFYRARTQ
jgi:hypothetical protein